MTVPSDPAVAVPPALQDAVLQWYEAHGRQLAFRATSDPYAVLVSELMAQQTQAARAADAWTDWLGRWPTVGDLAAAPLADVLRAWAGLGYNRRAIALHRAATVIVAKHAGRVPSSVEALSSLPGVGPYTARAVAAIAFGVQVGAVDVNVRRVLGRITAGGADALGAAAMQVLADAVVPEGRAAVWTHALMDLGAAVCRARTPLCGACPARAWCRYAAGDRAGVAEGSVARRGAAPSPSFPETRRWLRGRILARARDAADGEWVLYGDAMGIHDVPAVRESVAALAREGLLEARETADGPEARLPG